MIVRRLSGCRKAALALGLALLGVLPARAANWLPFGPDGGSARRVVADPSDHTHLYLGTANGWLYDSHNTGETWKRLARVDKRDDLVLDSVIVDAKNPKHLVVGARVIGSSDGGIYVSDDAGHTWSSQVDMRGESVQAMSDAPTDSNLLVAGTLKGVFRSTDGGRHWTRISPVDSTEIHNIASVAIDPVDPKIIYVGTWHLPWKTTDGGEHWENIKEGIIDDSDVFSIIIDPVNPKSVYASACSGIYKSEDAGGQFKKIQGIPSTARRTRVLEQDPTNEQIVFAGTTEGLWRTNDAGKSWNRTTGPEVIVNDVSIDKTNPKHVLIATDRGGVLSSDDGGDSFHPSNGGFSARQIVAIHRDRQHPGTVLVGVVNDKELGGVFLSENGGLNWKQRSDGFEGRDIFALGQAPDGTYIAGTAHGLFRYDAGNSAWVKVVNAPAASAPPAGVQEAMTKTRPAAGSGHGRVTSHKQVASGKSAGGRTSSGKTSSSKGKATSGKGVTTRGRHVPVKQASVRGRSTTAARRTHAKAAAQAAPAAQQTSADPNAPPLLPPMASTGGAPADSSLVADTGKAASPSTVVLEKIEATPGPTTGTGFDGSVYGLATTDKSMLAITSIGLMTSEDNGQSWALAGVERSGDWRSIAAAKENVISASLHSVAFSADAGRSWSPMVLPEGLTLVGAVAVEPSGRLWIAGREGVYLSSDAGRTWTTPKNLFVTSVNSLYYDEATSRMLVTTGGYTSILFIVSLPDLKVTFTDSGWNLRFARPMGDHFIAATMFDGLVIQPRMVATPLPGEKTPGEKTPPAAVPAAPAPVRPANPPPASQ